MNGWLLAISPFANRQIFSTLPKPVALLAVAYSSHFGLAATGDAEGIVEVYDIKGTNSTPILSFQRNAHPICDLLIETVASGVPTLLVATSDGCVFRTNSLLDHGSVLKITVEYSGMDLDPICGLRAVEGKGVFSAGRDGIFRVYSSERS